jgi:hypothetical protein
MVKNLARIIVKTRERNAETAQVSLAIDAVSATYKRQS